MWRETFVTMHVRGINQNEAIKMVKRKITDLDAMKIQEQKKAARSGYDLDILPSDLSTYGGAAKNLLQDLQSRNERMFNMTFLMLHLAPASPRPTAASRLRTRSWRRASRRRSAWLRRSTQRNGLLNFFNHRTTVDIRNRLVCFDIKARQESEKPGMLYCPGRGGNTVTVNCPLTGHLVFRGRISPAFEGGTDGGIQCRDLEKRFRKWAAS